MTPLELKDTLNIVLTNYNKQSDININTLWTGLFIHFDANMFRAACLEVIKQSEFFPRASEIINAYQDIKNDAEEKHYEKLKSQQRTLATKQDYCYLCNNTGSCFYNVLKNGYPYEYVARCICVHGRDLQQYSQKQIERGDRSIYLPTIKEVLGDNFTIYDARKKDEYLSRNNVSDAEKAEMMDFIRKFAIPTVNLQRDNEVLAAKERHSRGVEKDEMAYEDEYSY